MVLPFAFWKIFRSNISYLSFWRSLPANKPKEFYQISTGPFTWIWTLESADFLIYAMLLELSKMRKHIFSRAPVRVREKHILASVKHISTYTPDQCLVQCIGWNVVATLCCTEDVKIWSFLTKTEELCSHVGMSRLHMYSGSLVQHSDLPRTSNQKIPAMRWWQWKFPSCNIKTTSKVGTWFLCYDRTPLL